ncbi:DUF5801 repeats-in-toxin domain-containing protein [Paracoccus methylarcula]|uniref:DUF5801 domain-containing protein n=1 Tax=Paracoccus methylarcula TaxID=72022 RepID=A0A3R7NB59_9RHOB|nr:DUF5801 repeats-in-toxin domain-containing protein [Paracoccus methylarcula]RNF33909.1 hypothetical protein A7A09_013385 [Paracoccus methylarcula]
MALDIIVNSGTYIDETAGLQADGGKEDIAFSDVPLAVRDAFTAAGADLSGALEIAGGGGNDLTISDGVADDLSFVDANGDPLDGVASGIFTHDGDQIFLYSSGDDVILGRRGDGNTADPDGDPVFSIYLEETGFPIDGARFWIGLFEPLAHPDGTDPDDPVDLMDLVFVAAQSTLEFDFGGAPAGQNEFMAFGEPGGSAIVVTGATVGDTVNSSQANQTSLGTNNQNVDAGEGLVVTYVQNMDSNYLVPNLSSTEASDAANIQFDDLQTANQGSVTLVKFTPPHAESTVRITALLTEKEAGTDFIPGIADDDVVNITAVFVNGEPWAFTTDPDGTVEITGIRNNDTITFETDGAHNRFLIENGQPTSGQGSNVSWNVGGVALAFIDSADTEVGSQLQFFDDGPSVVGEPQLGVVDEDGLPGGIAGGVDDAPGEATMASGDLTDLIGSGADTPATFSLSTDTSGLPVLTSGGAPVSYSVAGDLLTATAGGETVFTLQVNIAPDGITPQAGGWLFTLEKPLDHISGLDENDIVIELGSVVVATDRDNDSITMESGDLAVLVDDDTPVVSEDGTAPALEVDETDFATDASADFSGIFASSFGADGPGAGGGLNYSLALLGAATSLTDTLTGQPVTLAMNGADIVGSNTDGDEVLRISVDATGNVTLDQSRSVVHPENPDPNDAITLGAGTVGLTATAADADGDAAGLTVDVSGSFNFRDDGPVFSSAISDGLVTFGSGQSTSDSGFLDYGADGPGSFTILGFTELPDDTVLGEITETLSADGTTLTYTSGSFGDLFRLTLDGDEPGGYLFEVLQDAPLILNPLDFASVTPGGPKELEVVSGTQGTTTVTFDGFLSSNFNGDALAEYAAGNLPGDGADDVNISTPGIGLDDNQMDPGEQLLLSTSEDVEGAQVVLDGGTGKGTTFDVRLVAYDDGVFVDEFVFEDLALPKGSNSLTLDYLPGVSFDELFIFQSLDGNNGVRIKEISLFERQEVPDFVLETTARETDGDGDFVDDTFVIQIDGNADGMIFV